MGIRLGLDAKLYRNTGTYNSPNWEEMPNARDVTLSLEDGEADVTTRGNDGWRATAGTLKDASIEFQSIWDTDDEGFTALQEAFFTRGTIEILALDGDVTAPGVQGLRATMRVATFTRNEALEEAITVDVSLKPAYSANPPEWYTVGS